MNMKIIKVMRKAYSLVDPVSDKKPSCELDPNKVSNLISESIKSAKPLMIARFGAFELSTIVNYLGVSNYKKSVWKYIKGEEGDWIWNHKLIQYMYTNAGFFPPIVSEIEKFCQLMLEDKKHVDILGSWRVEEKFLLDDMKAKRVHIRLLEPFWSEKPWTKELKNKKVLVVHPFKKTIEKQYEKRKFLFDNIDILPTFESLTVIRAVQSIGGSTDKFQNWFDALEFMKEEVDKIDYDICLIGAGAYGFPLAAHVKRQGKQAIHLGGALQLLFGIKGNRWEDPNYGVKEWGIRKNSYIDLFNDYWVRADESEKPQSANKVEGGCYW